LAKIFYLFTLQRIAQQTNRLEKNWNQESPSVIGTVRVGPFRKEASGHFFIFSVIPGTDMLILYTGDQTLVCYDMQTGRPLADLNVGMVAMRGHYDVRGKHFVAMVSHPASLG
jgi:hypothetical protein